MKNYKYNMVARDNSIFSLKIMESYSLFSNTKKENYHDTTQETKCKIVKLSHDDHKNINMINWINVTQRCSYCKTDWLG